MIIVHQRYRLTFTLILSMVNLLIPSYAIDEKRMDHMKIENEADAIIIDFANRRMSSKRR